MTIGRLNLALRFASLAIVSMGLLAHAGPLQANQGEASAKQPAKDEKLFASDRVLEVTLTAPWTQVTRKQAGATAFPATLDFRDGNGPSGSLPLTVERRGITRLRICDFPPLKLRFEKSAIKGTLFRGNKSIKLVTHCDDGERWEQYYVIEMLAYRIYNLVTDRSFRVRPLSITYFDSAKQASDGPHFGFLIEDDSDVARRNGLDLLDIPRPRVSQLDALENSRFSLFQYMIGNTDWSVLSGPSGNACCHNTKLMGPANQVGIYAVPYDFDSAGLVDARYAAPSPSLPIKDVRQRIYRGFCENNAMLAVARGEMQALETDITSLVRNEIRLTDKSRESALSYLGEFFAILGDERKFAREITEKCRK